MGRIFQVGRDEGEDAIITTRVQVACRAGVFGWASDK